ncbi:unnamed protein product [Calicophoron daubneyi]|uniref:LysM domain-containing protein n=1 Tax=Calicophoron daubneyi TaxID=300641 RepID=A0AAV2U181_CALDB
MTEESHILPERRQRRYGAVDRSSRGMNLHKVHYITPGETLVSIAVHYGTTVQHLKLINHLWSADISALKTLKVPAENSDSAFIGGKDPPRSDSIELGSIRPIKACKNGQLPADNLDSLSASLYLKNLSERVKRAKETASVTLEKSRLPEILADASSAYTLQNHIPSHARSIDNPLVMVTTPSTSSSKGGWRGNPKRASYTTPQNWNNDCDL